MSGEQRDPIVKQSFDKNVRQGRDDKGVHKSAGIKEKDIPKGEGFKRHGASWLQLEQVE